MGMLFSFIKKFGVINFFFVILTLMNPLDLGYLFGYVSIGLLILKKDVLKNDMDSFFLIMFIFSTTYALFYFLNPWKGMQYFLIYFLTPPVFYLWGKQISKSANSGQQKLLILLFLGLLYSLPALISVVLNIYQGGFAQPDRNLPMFWGGNTINATGMAAFLMFNMCIPGMLISGFKDLPKKLTIILIIVFVLSLASVLRLGSRTQLGVMVISLLLALIYVSPKLSLKQNLLIYSIFLAIVLFIARNISFDIDSDLFTSFAGRMKDDGAKDLAGGGGRVDLWKKSLEFMFEYPLGWDLEAFGYSHNLWLDTLRVGGVLSFFLLILYFLKYIRLLYNLMRDKLLDLSNRLIILVYSIAFLAVFMVEPGIDGSFSMFLFYCLFSGFVFETNWSNKENVGINVDD